MKARGTSTSRRRRRFGPCTGAQLAANATKAGPIGSQSARIACTCARILRNVSGESRQARPDPARRHGDSRQPRPDPAQRHRRRRTKAPRSPARSRRQPTSSPRSCATSAATTTKLAPIPRKVTTTANKLAPILRKPARILRNVSGDNHQARPDPLRAHSDTRQVHQDCPQRRSDRYGPCLLHPLSRHAGRSFQFETAFVSSTVWRAVRVEEVSPRAIAAQEDCQWKKTRRKSKSTRTARTSFLCCSSACAAMLATAAAAVYVMLVAQVGSREVEEGRLALSDFAVVARPSWRLAEEYVRPTEFQRRQNPSSRMIPRWCPVPYPFK